MIDDIIARLEAENAKLATENKTLRVSIELLNGPLSTAALVARAQSAEAYLVKARATVEELQAALEPFAAVSTGHHPDEAVVSIAVNFSRDEAIAFNAEIDARNLPIKKAGTDPYAPDAGMNWPDHILDIDGIPLSAFRRASAVLATVRETAKAHDSSCAVHNEPAYPKDACTCDACRTALTIERATIERCAKIVWKHWHISNCAGDSIAANEIFGILEDIRALPLASDIK